MGVTPECVAAVVDASGGKFSDPEAAELIRYMEALKRAEEAAGNIDGLAARVQDLAAREADRARIAAAQAKRHAALAAVAYHRSLAQVRELVALGRRHDQALLAVFEGDGQRGLPNGRDSVQSNRNAALSRYLTPLLRLLETNDHIRKLVESGDEGFADQVVREMRELHDGGAPGITKNPEALTLARVYAEAAEQSRVDRNRFGASIGKLDGWSPQSHDTALVAKASQAEWIDFILPKLDAGRTFGPNMNQAQQRRILADIYDHIAMGLRLSRDAGDPLARVGPANLANKLGTARELHFTDAAAWGQYRKRFGQQHIHGAMLSHLERSSRDAALLELLGPNPEAMLATLRRQLRIDAAGDTRLTYAQRQKAAKALGAKRGAIDNAMAEASGLTGQPVHTRLADIMAGVRNQQRLAKLAGAVLSQVTDPAIRASRLTLNGAPLLESFGRSLGLFFGSGPSKAQREALASLGHGADGMRTAAIAEMTPEDSRPGMLARLTAATFRLQGMNYLSNRLRSGTAYMLAEWMGRNAGKGFAQLDPLYRRRLETYGVTPAMWDALRPLAQEVDGKRFLTPDLARDIPTAELAAMARPELEALQKGLTEKIARRAAADAQEAGWITRRTQAFEADLARATARMEAASARTVASGGKEIGKLRERIDELRTALSDLAEFQQAIAEGREWAPAAPEAEPPGIGVGDSRYVRQGDQEYVALDDGSIDLANIGDIAAAAGVEAAPVRLARGYQDTNAGPMGKGRGEAHAEFRHGKQVREMGYSDIAAFVRDVAANANEIRRDQNGNLFLIQRDTAKAGSRDQQPVLIVELQRTADGSAYEVATAGPFVNSYIAKRKLLWQGERSAPNQPSGPANSSSTPPRDGSGSAKLSSAGGQSLRTIGVPRAESYLHGTEPPEAAALRMEGELRHRLDRLRRAIGRVGQQAVRQDIRRLEGFEAQWQAKRQQLDDFAARVEQRGKARAAANLADRFQWQPQVDRVLEDTRRKVEMAFRRYYADEMLGSTLEPDAQLRRFLYQGTQPGTGMGEAHRALALFKGFPIAYAQRVLASAIHGYRPGERGRQAAHIASLIAASTLLGYVGMTAKDAVRGYSPRDPTHWKTWLAAMAQGGGIGIYGDFLFGQGNRFGNSGLETVAGPLLSGAANLVGIYQRAKEGDAKAGDALGVLLRETPFINLWWARPVLDISILNSIREWASPGTLRRQARQRENDFGQTRWTPETVWR